MLCYDENELTFSVNTTYYKKSPSSVSIRLLERGKRKLNAIEFMNNITPFIPR